MHFGVIMISKRRDTIRYSFGELIRQELTSFALEWNSHRIRRSNMAEAPPGVPNILFRYPELLG